MEDFLYEQRKLEIMHPSNLDGNYDGYGGWRELEKRISQSEEKQSNSKRERFIQMCKEKQQEMNNLQMNNNMDEVDFIGLLTDIRNYSYPIIKLIEKEITQNEAVDKYFIGWARTLQEKMSHETATFRSKRYYEHLRTFCDARISEMIEPYQQPEKVAKLVTFEITTRVVVDKNEMPEVEEEDAIRKGIDKVLSQINNDLCFDHCTEVVDDKECPYDPKTD